MDELKPCPFCGGNLVWCEHPAYLHAYISCKGCQCRGPISGNQADARRIWNQREQVPARVLPDDDPRRTALAR